MKRLIFITTATADIEERWVVDVDDESARLLKDEPYMALDLLAGNFEDDEQICTVIEVTTLPFNEEDRSVIRIEGLEEEGV